jgi:hypothetical protein
VGTAILRYKSLGSLPDNKLAGLKGLERLDAEIKSIMGDLRRSHTVRVRAESKAAFRQGVYHGIEEFATAQLPVYRELTPDGLDILALCFHSQPRNWWTGIMQRHQRDRIGPATMTFYSWTRKDGISLITWR